MANWINGAINSGYTVVSGSLTGTANAKVACWLEYRLWYSKRLIHHSTANDTAKYGAVCWQRNAWKRRYDFHFPGFIVVSAYVSCSVRKSATDHHHFFDQRDFGFMDAVA